MTTVYFVRHAQSSKTNPVDALRELSPKGKEDAEKVTAFLHEIEIDAMYASPYKRAVETIQGAAEEHQLSIREMPEFRERAIGTDAPEDFDAFARHQWEDFSYKCKDGECLQEVQERTVAGLLNVLHRHPDETVVIGTHGTALSTIMNWCNPFFGYEDYDQIKDVQPWIVEAHFDEDDQCTSISEFDFEDA